jgi:DNA recombination protein RmuC
MSPILIVCALLALALGVLLGWVLAASRSSSARAESAALGAQLTEKSGQLERLKSDIDQVRSQLSAEQHLRIRAEADRDNEREKAAEQYKLIAEAQTKLQDAFDASAAKALDRNNQQFLDLAKTNFATLQTAASGDLGKREAAIKGLVDPLANTLKTLEEKLAKDESSRREDYGKLAEQLGKLSVTSEDLRKETGSLVTSLRQPQIKGKWGEMLLRRALELTGMSPYCDFAEQPSMQDDEGRGLRPDLVVKLPGGGVIVIDSKVPQGAFLNALAAKSQDEYWAAMAEHARLVRNHVGQLASKKYWEQFPQSPEFVVLFLPAESFFSAALEQDKTLIEDAMDKRIILASPTTLLALLRTVAHGWRQERLAENAQEISELGKELHDRIKKFVEYMEDIGASLEKANKSFNSAVGSLETRLLPSARKLKEKGVQAAAEIPTVEPTEVSLRSLMSERLPDEE